MIHSRPITIAILFTIASAGMLLMLGCPKPIPPEIFAEEEAPPAKAPPSVVQEQAPEPHCAIARIHFDYDEASLTRESMRILDDNAACIERQGYGKIVIEGHCDERGSTEYNLALGQRRADAVRTYLSNLGVSSSSIKALSYGEERPLERGQAEVAWKQNRRAECLAD